MKLKPGDWVGEQSELRTANLNQRDLRTVGWDQSELRTDTQAVVRGMCSPARAKHRREYYHTTAANNLFKTEQDPTHLTLRTKLESQPKINPKMGRVKGEKTQVPGEGRGTVGTEGKQARGER